MEEVKDIKSKETEDKQKKLKNVKPDLSLIDVKEAEKQFKSFKIKVSFKKKLFIIITLIILGLLGAVYVLTLRDEKQALILQLKKRGKTMTQNSADNIELAIENVVSESQGRVKASIDIVDVLYIDDIIKNTMKQEDVAYVVILNSEGKIHSASISWQSFSKYSNNIYTPPEGVYRYIDIYNAKLLIEDQIISNNLNLYEKIDTLKPSMIGSSISPRLFNFIIKYIKDTKEEKRTYTFGILFDTKEKLLNIKRATKEKHIKRAIGKILDYFQERRSKFERDFDKLIVEKYFISNFVDETLKDIDKIYNSYIDIKDKLKDTIIIIKENLNKIKAISLKINPIVCAFNVKVKLKEDEFIDISYPIAKFNRERTQIKAYNGEIHIGMSLQGINLTIRAAARKLQIVALGAIGIGIVIIFMFASLMVNPIRRLVGAMERVGDGDINQEVKIKAKDEIGLLGVSFNFMTAGLREKEKMRDLMNKTISKEIAEELMKGEVKLGGERKMVTVLFSDIRSFTTISESLSPEGVIEMLNEYMSIMTNVIEKHGGIVDKFVGDEIMAVWGAPIGRERDPFNACECALEMMQELARLNEKRKERGEKPIDIGIGINTGEVVAGNMGSEKRMNYTVLGDNVNLGARLEGTNKVYKTHIIISEFTYEIVKDEFICRELDLIKVKGKKEPRRIYELIDKK